MEASQSMSNASPLKILLVNRHMNIGGVETYLYRLTAGLTARGHSVGLLTEGGLYESMAVRAGAKLHRVASLAGSWRESLAELKAENYEIVHAHNYHSARVGRALAKELGIPYLMSVHGPRSRFKQYFFKDWSDEIVVMSEGDKDNISWSGGAGKRPLHLSFYGIDVERFNPEIDSSTLSAELALPPDALPIVFISRFSNRKADVGHALLDALPTLAVHHPSVCALLVGEGPETASLARHCDRINRQSLGTLARMIGPRKDVERFMRLANVAVCTANTALEAMACGTPTLAAGRTGYFGLVSPPNFEAARALCFADHGRSPHSMSASRFVEELPKLLSDPAAARRAAQANAALIAEKYSVSKMAEQMEQLYLRLRGGH